MGRFLAPLAVIAVLCAAGCTQSPTAGTPRAVAEPHSFTDLSWDQLGGLVFNDTHDHADRALHVEVRRGVELLNRSALSESGKSLGEYTEADLARGLIAVAVVTGVDQDMRIVLLDATALPQIKVVGHFDEPGSYGDVKLDPVDALVYVPYAMGAVPDGRAFSVWDITNPGAPKRLGEVAGAGCHMLHAMRVGSTSYVYCAAIDAAQVYQIAHLQDGSVKGVPLGPAVPVGDPEVIRYFTYYESLGTTPRTWVLRVHDMTYQPDPLTQTPLLVTAHELQGIRIFDVTNPAAPRQVAEWRGQGLATPMDRVHTVGLAAIAGHRIAFASTETFNHVRPQLYIVDFTDYANPKLLAKWVPPGISDDETLTFSLHNFQVVGTRLYICNFHAGLWELDVSDPAHPKPLALSTPVWDTEYPHPGQMDYPGFRMDQNMYWDVVLANGYAVATDMSAGIEVLHFDGDPAGDATYASHF